ncbi:hypothetical protein Taro_041751 [Colocasia esculenta]|uniref:Uncharacterized protein n=1 Tax=Colocasia esculenta TaxID=4460 RepID=A0A843WF63_COLES|nr:hypothetical protein [Colocasia esculenta]
MRRVSGYNQLVDHVGIHGQRSLTEALNKDSLVQQKEYPTESSSKSRESVYIETSARRSRGILEQWSVGNGIPKALQEMKTRPFKIGQSNYIIEIIYQMYYERFSCQVTPYWMVQVCACVKEIIDRKRSCACILNYSIYIHFITGVFTTCMTVNKGYEHCRKLEHNKAWIVPYIKNKTPHVS